MANLLSFFGDIGKKLHGVEAQLNPWDGGQNYNTVVNNAPIQQQAQPQAQPVQRPNFNAPKLPTFNAPKILTPQAQQQWLKTNALQTQAPKIIPMDYGKAAGQVLGGVNTVGNFVLNNTAKIANQGAGVVENLGGNIAGGTQKLFGDQVGGQNTINAVKQRVDNRLLQKGAGLFGVGGIYNSSDALHNAKPQDVAIRAGGTALGSLAETLPIKPAVGIIKGAAPIVNKMVGGAALGIGQGAAYSAGSQLGNTGQVNAKQLAIDSALGGAMGAAIPAAVVGAQKLAPVIKKGAVNAADTISTKLHEPVAQVAEKASGLPRVNVLNDNEAHTLGDFADLVTGRWQAPNSVRNQVVMQARNAAKTAGFDITNMSPRDADMTIANYLQARDTYNGAYGAAKQQMMQGGFARVPGKEPNSLRTEGQVNNLPKTAANLEKPQTAGQMPVNTLDAKLSQQGQQLQGKSKMPTASSSALADATLPLQEGAKTNPLQKATGQKIANNTQLHQTKKVQPGAHQQNPVYHVKSAQTPEMVKGKVTSSQQQHTQESISSSRDSFNNTTTNSLTAKAKRQSLSDDVVKQLNATHQIRNTKELASSVERITNKMSDKSLIDEAHRVASVQTGTIDDAGVALVHKAIERADSKGNIREAVSLHDQLSAHLTKKGQEIQAASLLYNLTPQGRLYKATRDLLKAGVDVTSDKGVKLIENLKAQTEAIKKASPADKPMLTAKFMKTVADNIPKSAADNVISVWKAGLLSGVKTHGGNFVSNGTFAALHDISNPLAVGIDKLISLKTGQRTRSLTGKGRLSGAGTGVKKGLFTMKTGIDERNIQGNKYEIHGEINFKNPIVQKVFGKPSNAVFRAMSAGDQPFYYSQLKNSLYDMGKTDGINQGLRGQALRDHANGIVENPTEAILNKATLEAQQSVLGQDNKLASNIQRTLNNSGAVGKAGQIVAPFIKVPTNFLGRTLDFTPIIGHLKAAFKAGIDAKNGKGFDQRAFTQSMSEATTGGAVVILGAALAAGHQLSGDYPKNDQKEAQRWKAEGITPNSVKIGNTWIGLNYLGPVGMLLGMGKSYHDAGGGTNGAVQAGAGIGSNLTQQSFLTGFSGFSNALNDPQRQAKSFVSSQASSVIPNWMNDVANRFDSKQRDTSSSSLPQYVANSAINKIPFARRNLPVKQDVYGNNLDQQAGPNNKLLNPLKPSNALTNDVKSEVSRLHNVDTNNKDLQVTPTPIDKTLTLTGGKVALTDKQKYELQGLVGQNTQSAWSQLIKTPAYKSLDDTGKAAALNGLKTDVAATTSAAYAKSNGLGDKKLTAKQQAMAAGKTNLDSYTATKSAGGISAIAPNLDANSKSVIDTYNAMDSKARSQSLQSTPDAEYKLNQAKYANDKANGSVSDIQDISRQKVLAKDKVGSVYPKDVRDLYSMSKADINAYLNTNDGKTDKKKIGDQIIAYDRALKDAGLSTSLKFKTGIAPVAKGGKGGSKKAKGTSLSDLASILKASAAIKPPTPPKVSAPKATTYKRAVLRKYTPTKIAVSKSSKVTARRGVV